MRREAQIRKERQEGELKNKERRNRAFLESSSDDGELEQRKISAADMKGYLSGITSHLEAEDKIIGAWKEKDQIYRRKTEIKKSTTLL